MSYAAYRDSVQSSAPVECFQFQIGAKFYNYAIATQSVLAESIIYTPRQISRGAIIYSGDLNKNAVDITLPIDDELSQELIGELFNERVNVKILRKELQDSEVKIIFLGHIAGTSFTQYSVKMTCNNFVSSLKSNGCFQRWTISCRHPLYSEGCGANRENFRSDAVLVGSDGVNLTFDRTFQAGYFVGGTFRDSSGTQRLILSSSGNALRLDFHIDTPLGDACSLYAGCDHVIGTCAGKFNNIANYGGFTAIPSNPAQGHNVF